MRWLDGIADLMDMSSWWTGRPDMLQSWGFKESDMTEQLNWTECIKKSHVIQVVSLEVKNLPGIIWGIRGALGQEEALDEEMGTHSNIFAWRILWTEEPGRLQSIESQTVRRYFSNWAQRTFPINKKGNWSSWRWITLTKIAMRKKNMKFHFLQWDSNRKQFHLSSLER